MVTAVRKLFNLLDLTELTLKSKITRFVDNERTMTHAIRIIL